MLLYLKNICSISEAEVDISKISVIVGENNFGKSTIGKVLYILYKTFDKNAVDIAFSRRISRQIDNIINESLVDLRRFEMEERNKSRTWRQSSSHITRISRLLKRDIAEIYLRDCIYNSDKFNEKVFASYIERTIYDYASQFNYIVSGAKKISTEIAGRMLSISNDCPDYEAEYRVRFEKLTKSMLKGQLGNLNNAERSEIKLIDNDHEIVHIAFKADKFLKFSHYDDLLAKDVTLLETPMIIEYTNLIENSRSVVDLVDDYDYLSEEELCKDSTIDIVRKIKRITSASEDTPVDLIRGTINGTVNYNDTIDEFIYQTGDGKMIPIQNTASGIKTFGIMQMLIQKRVLNEDHLLILDEPEIHLHPKWQIEFVKLLAEIIDKYNVRVLITTHSPYFLDATRVLLKDTGVKYYNSNMLSNGGVIIKDCKGDLAKVYEKLAEPFETLTEIDVKGELFGAEAL